MDEPQKLTIPTEYLPENWKADTAKSLGVSVSTVGKVANGTRKNDKVFDHLLTLAEKGKQAEKNRLARLKQLTPQNA